MSKILNVSGRMKTGLLGLALAGMIAPASHAAMLLDVRAIAVNGNAIAESKAVTINEGDTITLGVFLSGIEQAAGNSFGLGSYKATIRSFGEMAGGVAYPISPTPTDTVVNATSFTRNALLGSGFDTGPGGSVADINAAFGNPDPNDTDADILSVSISQAPGGTPNTIGVGLADVRLFTADFVALTTTRNGPRTVNLNSYFTTGGTNGGLDIRALTSSDPDTSQVSVTNLASAGIIGGNVAVTVNAVPEPATLGVLGVGAACLLGRRRRNV